MFPLINSFLAMNRLLVKLIKQKLGWPTNIALKLAKNETLDAYNI